MQQIVNSNERIFRFCVCINFLFIVARYGIRNYGQKRMHHHQIAVEERRFSNSVQAESETVIPEVAFYRAISTAADAGLLVQAMDGTVLWTNNAYATMMGLPPAEIIGENPLSFALPPECRLSEAEIAAFRHKPSADNQPQISIYENVRSTGERFWVELHVSFDELRNYGQVAIVVARDISDHIKRQQELSATSVKLSHLAATDNLTGLSNRLDVLEKTKMAFFSQRKKGGLIGLLEIDLDHFKTINDSFGHSAGDAILCKLATTLENTIGSKDIAARVGGDEFLVLCPNVKSLDDIEDLGQRIIAQNQSTIIMDGVTLQCDLSIGAAAVSATSSSPEELLKRADFALYEAKNRGRGCVAAYNGDLHKRHSAEALLVDELTEAVKNKNLTFHFQPTMLLETGQVRGFEALVRWQSPRLGLVSPCDFLPLAKSLGLMADIDMAALEAALNLKKNLNLHGHTTLKVGLNGSAELLAHPSFYSTLMQGLEVRDLLPSDVVIEVLETIMFDDAAPSNPHVQIIKKLHDAGVITLLDDFGTGHAGLTHLATLAVSGVKIDRTLTRNVLTDPTCAKIIAMMLELCRDLGIHTVTEGIETAEQAQAIHDLGGQVMQGFWLSEAMPGNQIINWLATRENIADQIVRSPIAAAPSPRY